MDISYIRWGRIKSRWGLSSAVELNQRKRKKVSILSVNILFMVPYIYPDTLMSFPFLSLEISSPEPQWKSCLNLSAQPCMLWQNVVPRSFKLRVPLGIHDFEEVLNTATYIWGSRQLAGAPRSQPCTDRRWGNSAVLNFSEFPAHYIISTFSGVLKYLN